MTTTSNENHAGRNLVFASCPCCKQDVRLHAESIHLGTEIVCSECSSVLWIKGTLPLTLEELDEDDLLDSKGVSAGFI